IPLITNADISHLFTLTPDNLVASRLLPMENIYLPIFVLFKTTAANIAKATITKIHIGQLLLNLNILLYKPSSVPLNGNVTLFTFETMDPNPLAIFIVPYVAINVRSLNLATSTPLINPNNVPIPIIAINV